MTLADMASFICGKVNQSETEDLAACKGFLQRRFEMLWQNDLWKDSLVELKQTLNPTGYVNTSNWLPTKGLLLLPPIIQRVLAVRTDSRHLNIQRPEFYYRIDYDAFSKSGSPREFLALPPAVWELDVAAPLYVALSNAADLATLVVTRDLLDADGTGVTRTSGTLAISPTGIGTSDRVEAILKKASGGTLSLQDAAANVILTMAATDTAAPKRQRVRLVETPTASFTIRVLGKRKAPAFTDDLDEPALTGVENCLLAFGQADMLQRERHYSKAQALQQEGELLMAQLKEVEAVQQSHNQQIIPESGYGDDYFNRVYGFSF